MSPRSARKLGRRRNGDLFGRGAVSAAGGCVVGETGSDETGDALARASARGDAEEAGLRGLLWPVARGDRGLRVDACAAEACPGETGGGSCFFRAGRKSAGGSGMGAVMNFPWSTKLQEVRLIRFERIAQGSSTAQALLKRVSRSTKPELRSQIKALSLLDQSFVDLGPDLRSNC